MSIAKDIRKSQRKRQLVTDITNRAVKLYSAIISKDEQWRTIDYKAMVKQELESLTLKELISKQAQNKKLDSLKW
jgi:hypothetical protein